MEFETIKLKSLTEKIGSGSTPRGGKSSYLESGEICLIRSQNIYNHYFEPNGLAYISEEQADKLRNVEIKENDILINITGDSVARNLIANKDFLPARVNQHVSIIRCDIKKLNSYYLSAVLTSRAMQQQLLSLAQTGGTRAALTKGMLENLEIPIVDINKQHSIGQILNILNSKIENNNKVIDNLEQVAQTLFKRWFVDFEFPNENGEPYKSSGGKMVESELGMIPKGWEINKLEEQTVIVRGGSPRPIRDFIQESGIPWVKISDANASSTMYLQKTKEFIKVEGKSKSREVNPGTLILSNSATPGIPMIMNIYACVHDGWLIFDEYRDLTKEYIYLFLLNERREILSLSNGSVFRNLKTSILKNYPIAVPDNYILTKFQRIIVNINEQILSLDLQNEKLTELRDTLLPKLLSGEIELPETMEVLDDVPVP